LSKGGGKPPHSKDAPRRKAHAVRRPGRLRYEMQRFAMGDEVALRGGQGIKRTEVHVDLYNLRSQDFGR